MPRPVIVLPKRNLVQIAFLILLAHARAATVAPAPAPAVAPAPSPVQVLISVPDQRLAIVRDGELVARFPVSTSRFGVGDNYGSYKTPLGEMRVCEKIGGELQPGAVIRHRAATGEVLSPNAPGRDPIVTRVIWLDGLESQNRNARSRGIYIHGTPQERTIGTPASYGCIRMRSRDVIRVFDVVPVGSIVSILPSRLPHMRKYEPAQEPQPAPEPQPAVAKSQPASKAPEQPARVAATESPAPIIHQLATRHQAEQLAPVGEPPSDVSASSSSAAAARLKGSLLLANLPKSARD